MIRYTYLKNGSKIFNRYLNARARNLFALCISENVLNLVPQSEGTQTWIQVRI